MDEYKAYLEQRAEYECAELLDDAELDQSVEVVIA